MFHASYIKCPKHGHAYLLPAAIPLSKMETEDYLQQSIGKILGILSKPKTQPPFLTYRDTATSAIESIAKLIQREIPRAPPIIPTSDPIPTSE